MNSRRVNLLLWTAATLLCVLGVLGVALALLVPLSEQIAESPSTAVATVPARVTPATQSAASPLIAQIEHASSLRLRRMLGEPENIAVNVPTVATTVNTPSTASDMPGILPITLVGTIGDSLALLRTQAGTVEVRSVGESLAGALILSVRPRHVEVRFNDKVVAMDKPVPDLKGVVPAGTGESGTPPEQPGNVPEP